MKDTEFCFDISSADIEGNVADVHHAIGCAIALHSEYTGAVMAQVHRIGGKLRIVGKAFTREQAERINAVLAEIREEDQSEDASDGG